MQYTENQTIEHLSISMWEQNEYLIYCKCNQKPTNEGSLCTVLYIHKFEYFVNSLVFRYFRTHTIVYSGVDTVILH
jgi:hypothetical protein